MTDFEKTYQNYNPRQAALDEARALLTAAAKAAMADGTLPEAELPAFIVEIPADVKNGDIASNLAMAGARTWRKAPKMIADALLAHLPSIENSVFSKVEVAGPGFINLFLSQSFWAGVVLGACANKEYGRTDHGKGAKYNVEFVSANPTGPMHMGNARGGALGDCLAAVLDWSGYDVTREFYINDAGNQIQKFGKSLAVRYLQQFCGEEAYPLPKECYQGGDIKVLAGEFAELNGDKYVAACKGLDEEALFESEAFAALKDALVAYALPKNIAALKRDLGKYRIDYDVWFHESTLHESGAVLAVVDKLLELGACYKAEDGAIMYRSAQYAAKYGTVNKKKTEDGTEEEAKDEVLVRANGIPTYFAADIAYHYNKLATRGFAKAIDVWGADHHGHVARMKGAMDAIGLNGEDLDVVLMQMVNLMRDGQPVRMSKRTGNAITLTDLLEEVPIDSARFLFNMHDAGSGIDFDLDQAVKTDNDNPVYYVQYAHARICSILKKMESEGVQFAGAEHIDATLLTEPSEMDLIRMLAAFPQEIVMAAEKYDPSRINRFVIDLASAFHRFYGNCRIQGADPAVQQARLALCIGVKNVIFNVLTMFKINVPEKMYHKTTGAVAQHLAQQPLFTVYGRKAAAASVTIPPVKMRLERSAELVGAKPLHLLTQTALPLKSPTGAFIAALRSANAVAPNAKLKIIFPLNMRRATQSAFKIVYPKTDTRRTHGTFEDWQYHPAPPGGVRPYGGLYGCPLPPPDGAARRGLYGQRDGVQPGAGVRRP